MPRSGLAGRIVLACGIVAGAGFGGWALVPAAASWGGAVDVSRSRPLSSRDAGVESVSCAAPGDCAAGGYYKNDPIAYARERAFVVDETNGRWGKPVKLSDTDRVVSVSCATVGNCAAGGFYTDRRANQHAFVVSEANGSWGDAAEVPGTETLNSWGDAHVNSVSCGAAGDCAAGGYYGDGSRNLEAFVASETNGVWSDAIEVPGIAALNTRGNAQVSSISCVAAGECAAGGYYKDGSGNFQAFAVSETNGRWGGAIKVPGTGRLNSGGDAEVKSVSCATAGDCIAGGSYTDGARIDQAFVVNETNGGWDDAIQVPGTAATIKRGVGASVFSVSCAASGDCAVGGYDSDGSGVHAFVVSETNGRWGDVVDVQGSGPDPGGAAGVLSVSCAAVGHCAAGGYYDGRGTEQAFVVSERNGNWGDAVDVPGTPTVKGTLGAGVLSVSCGAADECVAGGDYKDGSGFSQAFVASGPNGNASDAIELRLAVIVGLSALGAILVWLAARARRGRAQRRERTPSL